MELISLSLLIIILTTSLLLGMWVFQSNTKSSINRWFIAISASIIFWNIFAFLGYKSTDVSQSLLYFKFNFSAVALFFIAFYYFTLFFPSSSPKRSRVMDSIITIICSVFAVLSLSTSYIIERVQIPGEGKLVLEVGSLGNIFYLFTIILTVYILYILIKKNVSLSRISQSKNNLFIIGTVLYAICNAIFSIGVSFLYPQNYNYTQLGDFSVILFIGITAYAIVKNGLMDIRMVVARSISYTLLLIILAGGYALAIFGAQEFLFAGQSYSSGQIAVQVILAIIMAFTFQPLRRFLTRITDKVFFKNDYNFEDLLKELVTTANGTLILIELLYKTIDILVKKMKVTRGIFILLDEGGEVYTTQSLNYTSLPNFNSKEVVTMSKNNLVISDELEEGSKLKHFLKKFNANLSLSLISEEGKPLGILLFGEKASGELFNTKDIKLFEILMPELSIAIHRAKEHEKVQRFNVTLQAEVAKKTKELQSANEHLEELDKAKDEFISMASHQLRTPLTAIKGYLSMLLEGDAGEIKMAQYDFVNEAYNAAARMVSLINDLLNVSRMETGRFFLEPVDVSLEIMIKEEIKQLQNHADEKNIYIKFEKKKDRIPKIKADETKIRQVVMNFIDNAIYYTQKGGVTVSLDANKSNLIFKVSDTGIGVPQTQQKNLFSKFYRADNARRMRPDGTGLGIYLAKKVIEDHGGEIHFDSVEGQGSTFGFTFPLKSRIKKELTIPPPDLAIASMNLDTKKEEEKKDETQEAEPEKPKSSALF